MVECSTDFHYSVLEIAFFPLAFFDYFINRTSILLYRCMHGYKCGRSAHIHTHTHSQFRSKWAISLLWMSWCMSTSKAWNAPGTKEKGGAGRGYRFPRHLLLLGRSFLTTSDSRRLHTVNGFPYVISYVRRAQCTIIHCCVYMCVFTAEEGWMGHGWAGWLCTYNTMVNVIRSISCLSFVLCWRNGEWPLSSLYSMQPKLNQSALES